MLEKRPPRILIIAGSDSGGGAGIQADIKTVTMLGGFAMTAITAVTAQNTKAVEGVVSIPADFVLKQIDLVLDDLGADAVKIGMIGSAETAQRLAERLSDLGNIPIVFDPVMIATSGSALADADTVSAFNRLMRIAALVTPNVPELEVLTGEAIASVDALESAALHFARDIDTPVLAKGGHLPGETVFDLLAEPQGRVTRYHSSRLNITSTHGTGCTLASAIACGLGQGRSLESAIHRARDYVFEAIKSAPGYGAEHGPVGHTLGVIPVDLIHKNFS